MCSCRICSIKDVAMRAGRIFRGGRSVAIAAVLSVLSFFPAARLQAEVVSNLSVANQVLPGIIGAVAVSVPLGLADTHSHQMSVHGFGGGLIWGDPHETDRKVALKACKGGDHGFPKDLNLIAFFGKLFGADVGLLANEVVEQEIFAREKYCEAGGYTGTGSGYQGFPIWGSMTKQQLSQPDLLSAHEGGDLNLLVMSAVSFQPLCDYLPTDNRKYFSYYYNSSDSAYLPSYLRFKSYTCSEKDNIMAQINFALDYEAANSSWYKIVRSATEAREAILEGKLAVVLHIESTNLFQSSTRSSEPDVNYYLGWAYAKGVRSIQLTHELDNWAAGVAYWDAIPNMARLANCMDKKADSNPFNNCVAIPLASQGPYKVDLDSNDNNLKGLTSKGETLVRSMYASCMIPDLAHASARAFTAARTISRESAKDYPLFVSHAPAIQSLANYGVIDEYQKTETQLNQIRDSGGLIGLRTAPYKMKTYSASGVSNTCHGSTRSYLQTVAKARDLGVNVALAFDMSGMAQNLGPRFAATGTKWEDFSRDDKWVCPMGGTADSNRTANGTGTNYDYIGLGHIGMTGNLMSDIAKLGYVATDLEKGAVNFIGMWEKIEEAAPGPCQYRYRTTTLP